MFQIGISCFFLNPFHLQMVKSVESLRIQKVNYILQYFPEFHVIVENV